MRIPRRASLAGEKLRARKRFASRMAAGPSLHGCDHEYEFRVGECLNRNRLLVLDDQCLPGMQAYSADVNFACCRHQIARVPFPEGIACVTASLKQGPI